MMPWMMALGSEDGAAFWGILGEFAKRVLTRDKDCVIVCLRYIVMYLRIAESKEYESERQYRRKSARTLE